MSNMITVQINQLAKRFDLPESEELYQVLKSTAFKGDVSDAQLSALLIVAQQYGLNPWIKQIYAFPDKNNGIVPVVGVDGWTHIINTHLQYDGVEFEQDDIRCTCIIFRKDRSHATRVTEYMAECRRDNAIPWKTHPYRMLRHKALIQCARLAFGFSGIYDTDEAERIIENQQAEPKTVDPATGEIRPKEVPPYPAEGFDKNLPAWRGLIESGKKTADQIIATLSTKGVPTEEQVKTLRAIKSNVVEMEAA